MKNDKQKKSSSLADFVIEKLQKEIASGKFKKGTKIPPEPELMERYNVGRSTIREAIKTLAKQGMLKVQQGSGTFVTGDKNTAEPLEQKLRKAAAKEINEVSTLLAKETARLATINRKEKDVKALVQTLGERAKAIGAAEYDAAKEADVRFHSIIAKTSGNTVMADLYETFTQSIRNRDKSQNVSFFQSTQKLLEQLLTAIQSQNEKKAATIISQLPQ
ncbi:FadR/GntR family transcriptional regulator [Taibaiella soli]|uniref:FadR family transcriptional regulator n=1 Tax=Taibaiella soli TaxID=1649169 RepID=A0A2W2AKJ6_9BACT|nr:GntR family transcriptional regulator [Taibaiella soli]PZF72780.1 FadR family transcriptional regulator [Taibaiella soli]